MKKYTLVLFVFALFITLLSFNTKPVSASNCAPGDLFNAATGQPCADTNSTSFVSLPTGFNRQLAVGSKGEDVKAVQQILKDIGFLSGKVDGSYGPVTKSAVMKYQVANSISSTGIVDSNTLVKIKLILWYKMCPLINSTYGVSYPCPSSLVAPYVPISPILTPVNGVCGTTLNVCTAGTLNNIADSSTNYLWNCAGLNGGSTIACSANIQAVSVNGVCGTTMNVCTTGTLNDIADSSTNYLWNCAGTNGGTIANCSANKQSSGTADLTSTLFKAPSAGSNNLGFSATATVANLSTSSVGPFNVKIYMGSQLLVNGTQRVSALGAGSSVSLSFSNLKFGGLLLHTYYHITLVVDADNEVGETNEDNNTKSRDYEVM
jgi:hypothetical protein